MEKTLMTPAAGAIAAVVGADRATIQPLFAALIAEWRASGMKIVGVIAETHDLQGRPCGAGFLRDIVSGKPYRIYLETPPSDASCNIDGAGVETACEAILDQIATGDLVVLSKFGKLETMHQGLAPAFEAAVAAGKPVLTSVSDKHRDAWRAFAPQSAFLAPDKAEIEAWRQAACAASQTASTGV